MPPVLSLVLGPRGLDQRRRCFGGRNELTPTSITLIGNDISDGPTVDGHDRQLVVGLCSGRRARDALEHLVQAGEITVFPWS